MEVWVTLGTQPLYKQHHTVPTEQPTVFHTTSRSLMEVMYMCVQKYVNKCFFLNRWVFPYTWSHEERLIRGSLVVVFLHGCVTWP